MITQLSLQQHRMWSARLPVPSSIKQFWCDAHLARPLFLSGLFMLLGALGQKQ